jgi:Predicted aminopeptidases
MNLIVKIKSIAIMAIIACAFCGCGSRSGNVVVVVPPAAETAQPTVKTLPFDADSAYRLIERQLDFGYRVPGTPSHDRCGDWLAAELASRGADTVLVQRGEVTAWNGDRLPIANIMGRWNPDAEKRVLLLAHWDSRPWADRESDAAKRDKPIPGANDGGSGVAVLLELARGLSDSGLDKGVDILFVDAEDYGTPEHASVWSEDSEDTWCLGTQYWLKNLPEFNGRVYKPDYAILLDMVGGYDAKFHREYFSGRLAPKIVDKVWSAAAQAGHGNRFVNDAGSPVTDDHVYLLKAGIPAVNIIECANSETGTFNPTWHTHADGIGAIDRETLKAVGETVARVLSQD